MMGVLIAVIVAIVIIVIVAWAAGRAQQRYSAYLGGLWTGNVGYLGRAQLSDFQLFIGPRETRGGRQGYLIMTDLDGAFVANLPIELHETPSYRSALRASLQRAKDVYTLRDVGIKYDDAEFAPPMPSRLRLALSMLDGTLTLYDGKTVYAFLEKDLSASAVATEAYGAPIEGGAP
jgi:hypothetical protein